MKITTKRIFSLLTGLAMLALSSCGPRTLTKAKLESLIEHSPELNQVQEIGGIKVGLKYCPYQFLVEQELESGGSADTARLNALKRKYEGQYYFKLSYSKDNKEVIRALGSYQRYSDMLQVFAFELGRSVNASTEKNDSLPLKDYTFTQDFGMATATSSMLVFNRDDFSGAATINVNIGEFGLGIGNMRFGFKQDALRDLPELKYGPMTKYPSN